MKKFFLRCVYLIFVLKAFQLCFLALDSKLGEHPRNKQEHKKMERRRNVTSQLLMVNDMKNRES